VSSKASSKVSILITALLAINVGIASFFIGFQVSEGLNDNSDPPKTNTDSDSQNFFNHSNHDENRRYCPPKNSSVTDSAIFMQSRAIAMYRVLHDSQIEKCKQNLQDIQTWCNPYCQDELNECRNQQVSLHPLSIDNDDFFKTHLILR